MKHNIIGILLVICVAITFLGVASAAEVTVSGDKFNIPDGFEKEEGGSYFSKSTTMTEECVVYDNGEDYFSIFVCSSNGGPILPPDGPEYEEKTIKGIDGKYCEDENGESFTYISNDKTVSIYLSANSTLTFEDIIIADSSEGDSGFPFNLFD